MNAFDSQLQRRAKLRDRIYALLCAGLTHPRAGAVVLVAAIAGLLASLDTGLAADDYLHAIMLDRPSPIPGFARPPYDIFHFCDPQRFAELLRAGIFSWWDDPAAKLRFMRPITAYTHVFDHALFRNQGPLLHLHSVLWSALLLFGVLRLFRALCDDRLVANLAFALYALDDARGWLVSWVAGRNAAVGTALSVWCLVAHDAERRGRLRTAGVLGPGLFAAALLASEGSIATCAYLLGSALFIERDAPPLRRVLRLWPYALVLIAWRIAYRAFDYGVFGSSLYLHPLQTPGSYLAMLAENGPMLLAAAFGGMWSDAWTLLFVAPVLRVVIYCTTLACLGALAYVAFGSLKRAALGRYALLGALLSILPASATAASDRLLTWVGIGVALMLAVLIAPVLRDAPHAPPGLRVAAGVLLCLHAIDPLLLPSRARANFVMRSPLDRAEQSIPRDRSITDKTLIYVNAPLLPLVAYLPIERAGQGVPRPRAMHVLGVGVTDIALERLDARRLRVQPRGGFLLDPASKLMWSQHRPFHPGERIVQGDMAVDVLATTPDHRPLAVELRFARVLEDPSYLWRCWSGVHTVPCAPPRVGQRSVLPEVDFVQVMFGAPLPISLRM